jgi:tetratricopeptide (TPR) repeat protein
MKGSRAALLLLLVTLLAAPGHAVAADETWLRVTTPNFVVLSDAGEPRARAIAERLEAFRRNLLSVFPMAGTAAREPLVVVAFRNDDGFTPLKPLYGDTPAPIAGIYLSASGQSLIALDASADESSYRVVLHEYVHRVLDSWDVALPLWLNEGLAELYSTAEPAGDFAVVGLPVTSHQDFFRSRLVHPLAAAFSVGPEATEYNERSAKSYFYAQSWAVAHYLTFERGVADTARLQQYAARLSGGEDQSKVFEDVFGISPEAADREVRLYVRRAELPRMRVRVAAPAATYSVRVEPAAESDVEAYRGLVLAFQGRYDDAVARLTRALGLDPTRALPYEGLGLVAMYRNDLNVARAAFAKAIERDATSFRANYYFARVAVEGGADPDDPQVIAALRRAVALNPEFAESYGELSVMARRAGDYPASLEWAQRGIKLAPGDGKMRLALALAQMANRDYAASRANLRQVIATEENADTRIQASLAFEWLQRYLAAVGADLAAVRARIDVPVAVMSDLPAFLYLAPAAVRGTLRRIECDGSVTAAYVDVDGVPIVFSSGRGKDVMILTLNHPGVEAIDCGKRIDRRAVIEIDPTGDDRRGRLRAIVFLAPARNTIVLKRAD